MNENSEQKLTHEEIKNINQAAIDKTADQELNDDQLEQVSGGSIKSDFQLIGSRISGTVDSLKK